MMRWFGALVTATCLLPLAAQATEGNDWPCVQRKVPELSLGQIWTGPELPSDARDWKGDDGVVALVTTLAQRRMPLDEAERQIKDFAEGLPESELHNRMAKLTQGLFDRMNAERSDVIAAIGRYSRKQLELAALLRERASELAAMQERNDPEAASRTRAIGPGNAHLQ